MAKYDGWEKLTTSTFLPRLRSSSPDFGCRRTRNSAAAGPSETAAGSAAFTPVRFKAMSASL